MTIIDLTNTCVVVESDGTVKCVNCIDGGDYQKGYAAKKETLVTRDDLKNSNTLIICDYCEKEVD